MYDPSAVKYPAAGLSCLHSVCCSFLGSRSVTSLLFGFFTFMTLSSLMTTFKKRWKTLHASHAEKFAKQNTVLAWNPWRLKICATEINV